LTDLFVCTSSSVLLLCGVVWCGVVWCGVVWSGVEWGGMEWNVLRVYRHFFVVM
jgi:hypothetical protein